MADPRILIVVSNAEAGKAYTQALSDVGASYDIVPTFCKMSAMAMEHAYNGLIIDIVTLVRCSKEEKVIAYECINLYPVLRVKWEAKHKTIQLSPLEQSFSPDAESALRFFVQRCTSFPARPLRKHKRKQVNLNALLSTDQEFAASSTEKTFTVSISEGGVFLHTMQSFKVGETVWLRFVELNRAPIRATVRWVLEWGESRSIPGIGLQFIELSEHQLKEILGLF
jgi:Tfp pilus assembly protein PilZ